MSDEKVLFHDDAAKVTVTDQRLIYGDDVTEISQIKHAMSSNSDGIKEHFIAVVFGIVGLWLIMLFHVWSIIIGLILLINPLLVFVIQKKKYWVFVILKSGSALEEGASNKRMFTKEVAKGITDAVNAAADMYRRENDPRKNLKV